METSPLHYNQRIYADLFDQVLDGEALQSYHLLVPSDFFKSLVAALPPTEEKRVVFLGSGNYHYLTLGLLAHFQESLSLVVFDHHVDAGDLLFSNFISCGSWIGDVIEDLGTVDHVYVIGPNLETYPHKDLPRSLKGKLSIIQEENLVQGRGSELNQMLKGKKIYLSIDRDILSQEEVLTNWDQGKVLTRELLAYIDTAFTDTEILGADICGDLLWSTSDFISSSGQVTMHKSRTNLGRLLGAIEAIF